jgi:hypothetical protein
MEYNHKNPSRFTEGEVKAAVGKRATISLTGEIVGSGVSSAGPYVKLKVDESWGFGELVLMQDLDALVLEGEIPHEFTHEEVWR